MKVLHLNAGNLYGGVESFLLTLARCRDLCPEMQPSFGVCFEERFSQELEKAGATIYRLGGVQFSRPWSVWSARKKLGELLRRERFSVGVCHMPWSHAVFGPCLRRAGVPLVHWAHGVTLGRHWLERQASRTRPNAVLCNSKLTASSVPNLFRGVPTRVVTCAVETAGVSRSAALEVRSELGAGLDTTVIVQVSRMEAWKGQRILLEALGGLPQDGPKWACWIVGGAQRETEQTYLSSLERQSKELGIAENVRFLGSRPDVRRLLGAADIFCQPNLEAEPFGLTFIEAMAAGLPVVSTAIGSALEIVNEECGVLVPAGEAGTLAQVLHRLMTDREYRRLLGDAGPARAKALCDPSRQLQLMAETFRQAMA